MRTFNNSTSFFMHFRCVSIAVCVNTEEVLVVALAVTVPVLVVIVTTVNAVDVV